MTGELKSDDSNEPTTVSSLSTVPETEMCNSSRDRRSPRAIANPPRTPAKLPQTPNSSRPFLTVRALSRLLSFARSTTRSSNSTQALAGASTS